MFGRRILIAVPHPDDEIVACAAAIGRAKAAGAEIFALYLTHGCIARETLWPWQRARYDANVARRYAEAKQVAEKLGLTIIGASRRPARHLWRDLPAVWEEITTALTLYSIDQIWVPAYEGGNADHDGLNGLSSLLTARASVLEFAEYNWFQGRANAQTFPCPTPDIYTIALSEEERRCKRACLDLYASEKLNLSYVGTSHESSRPLAAYDYSHPPHPGTLWYTRFHWVPFKHPRVDFTRPEDVSRAIEEFRRTHSASRTAA